MVEWQERKEFNDLENFVQTFLCDFFRDRNDFDIEFLYEYVPPSDACDQHPGASHHVGVAAYEQSQYSEISLYSNTSNLLDNQPNHSSDHPQSYCPHEHHCLAQPFNGYLYWIWHQP